MGRHAPLTDDQRAAIADRAVEQVADTLVDMQEGELSASCLVWRTE